MSNFQLLVLFYLLLFPRFGSFNIVFQLIEKLKMVKNSAFVIFGHSEVLLLCEDRSRNVISAELLDLWLSLKRFTLRLWISIPLN